MLLDGVPISDAWGEWIDWGRMPKGSVDHVEVIEGGTSNLYGNGAIGGVISFFALMRFMSALGSGRLVDSFGERIILATGIGIVAVSTGLAGLSQNYEQLLILRGFGGVGSAMFTVSASSAGG